jgi:hypothetical protein
MINRLIITLATLGVLYSVEAQENDFTDLGLELQVYPTGIIPGVRLAHSWNHADEVHLRLGYQFINHRDLGVQAEEKGTGFGFTLGYRRYLNRSGSGWSMGFRNDLWWNTIDWNSGKGTIPYASGTTEILVVQPTLEVAYTFLPEDGNWTAAPSIAFGYEVNVVTNGEPTGEGAILLVGIVLSQRF